MDIETNTEFSLELTPEDDEIVYSQISQCQSIRKKT